MRRFTLHTVLSLLIAPTGHALAQGEEQGHWAFQPIGSPTPPEVRDGAWVSNPIDAFIADGQQKAGVSPAPEASPHALVRRLYLDLLGLPPSPDEVDAFLNDPSPDAYERLVDRLLASPHYGERWGRHWLDLARWAESEGYESNHLRPFAWRYRDWVIDSFNADKPYRDFVREQLAGDEIVPYRDENLIATGFLAAARLSSNEEDKPRQRNDMLVDVVNATGSVFLGLTIHCAQCHNHKFDPIKLADYYRLAGFFVRGQIGNYELKDQRKWHNFSEKVAPGYEEARKLYYTLYEEAQARLIIEARKKLPPEQVAALEVPPHLRSDEQERLARLADLKFQATPSRIEKAILEKDRKRYNDAKKLVEETEAKLPRPQTFAFYSPATSPTGVEHLPMKGFYPLPYVPGELEHARTHLLLGGDVHRRGPALEPAWPGVLGETPAAVSRRGTRLDLADWLTDPRHPLTWRVYVNRVWHYHFGKGLVGSLSNFGTQGDKPTHPELLDWLAGEFLRSGGSTRHLHRLILTSSTYRQSARGTPTSIRRDPDNRLYTRWTPRRLEAEALRDAVLTAAGSLDRAMHGPGIEDGPGVNRRSIYVRQVRDKPPAWSSLFDGPSGVTESSPCRHATTAPLQALYLLNNDFVVDNALSMVKRVESLAAGDEQRIQIAFRLTLGREADGEEMQLARKFLARNEPGKALVLLCEALLNLNEFAYLE